MWRQRFLQDHPIDMIKRLLNEVLAQMDGHFDDREWLRHLAAGLKNSRLESHNSASPLVPATTWGRSVRP